MRTSNYEYEKDETDIIALWLFMAKAVIG